MRLHVVLVLLAAAASLAAAQESEADLLLSLPDACAENWDSATAALAGAPWVQGTPPCGSGTAAPWRGVTCNEQGRIVKLAVTGGRLRCTHLPGELAQLPALQYLDLKCNALNSSVPAEWRATGSFPVLQTLNLADNLLTGSLDDYTKAEGGPLASVVFNVSRNLLSDSPLPASWHSAALQVLDVSYNRVPGSLPAQWAAPVAGQRSAFPQLHTLMVQGNSLEGDYPYGNGSAFASNFSITARPGNGMLEGAPAPTAAGSTSSGSSGLSAGAIAGIVVGSVAAAALVAVLAAYALRRRRQRSVVSAAAAVSGTADTSASGKPGWGKDLEAGSGGNSPPGGSAWGSLGSAPPPPGEASSLRDSAMGSRATASTSPDGEGSGHGQGSANASASGAQEGSGAVRLSDGAAGDTDVRRLPAGWATVDFGELELSTVLGQGSFGCVRLAKWCHTTVAVKMMTLGGSQSAGAADEEQQAKLLRQLEKEAAVMSQLHHPNVCHLLAITRQPACLVMEYASRRSIDKLLAAGLKDAKVAKQLSWPRLLGMALDAARGMLYLHSRAVYHRDLKSANLLVCASWQVKVADFNLSRGADSQGMSTVVVQNPRWLAPERLAGGGGGLPSDVWAFGTVLWELLTWRHPHDEQNAYQIIHAVQAAASGSGLCVPPANALPAGSLSQYAEYVALMEACWAREPAQRPTMEAVATRLRTILAAEVGRPLTGSTASEMPSPQVSGPVELVAGLVGQAAAASGSRGVLGSGGSQAAGAVSDGSAGAHGSGSGASPFEAAAAEASPFATSPFAAAPLRQPSDAAGASPFAAAPVRQPSMGPSAFAAAPVGQPSDAAGPSPFAAAAPARQPSTGPSPFATAPAQQPDGPADASPFAAADKSPFAAADASPFVAAGMARQASTAAGPSPFAAAAALPRQASTAPQSPPSGTASATRQASTAVPGGAAGAGFDSGVDSVLASFARMEQASPSGDGGCGGETAGGARVAVAQMTSGSSTDANFLTVSRLAQDAVAQGCKMLFLPENVSFLGTSFTESLAIAEPLDGPLMQRYRQLAASLGLWLSLGGFQEKGPDSEHLYNCHVIIDDRGSIVASYRKIHLFNVDVPGGPVLMESRFTAAGDRLAACDSPAGRLGLSVCYDLRFPELYQRLAWDMGAQVLLVPSAFTVATGKAHWEVLLRARAIETQCYVIAAAQAGRHNEKRESYGHSLIIDPWGAVVGRLEDPLATGIAVADIDLRQLAGIRERMPVQEHRLLGRPAVLGGGGGGGSGGGRTGSHRAMRAAVLGCLLAAYCLAAPAPAAARKLAAEAAATPVDPNSEFFVRIEDGEFVTGCERFLLAGWNQWEVVEAAAGAPALSGASIPVNMTGPELVRDLLQKGKANGFNVMRTWAHTVNPQFAMQTAPGRYNEAALRGLDYLLDEARKAGIKLILAFTSNWTPTGGVPEYLKWCGSTDQVDFFTKPECVDIYQGFVKTILNRVNTINGRTYKNDPTIMAWNLLNEPRCQGCPAGTVGKWMDHQARYVKSIAANHLVTTGEEGFFGCCKNPANPGQPYTEWAAEEGQDFILDHSSPAIDYAAIHAWPDNWQQLDPAWLATWVSSHAEAAQKELKKPLVLEEFGKVVSPNFTVGGKSFEYTLEQRNSFLNAAYADINKMLQDPASGLKGALFWQWFDDGQEAGTTEGGGRGLYGIYSGDDAFKPILENAQLVGKLNQQPVAACVPAQHKVASLGPVPDCKETWVDGRAGTGKEGPDCDVPINECVRGTASCSPRATCIDTEAGYECRCFWGYQGDGKSCAPNTQALKELQQLYWSEDGMQACDIGYDVAWPATAPGYVQDPLDSFAFFRADGAGAYGSRANVTLQDCMIACQQAEECESFTYNAVLMQCFLKREQVGQDAVWRQQTVVLAGAAGQRLQLPSRCPLTASCPSQPVFCNSTNDRGESFSFPCGTWTSFYRLDMDVESACANNTSELPETPGVADIFDKFEAGVTSRTGGKMRRITPGAEPVTTPAAATATGPAGTTTAPSVELIPSAAAQPWQQLRSCWRCWPGQAAQRRAAGSWELMEAAAGAPQLTGSVLPPGMTGPAMVRDLLDEAAAAGLTVVRAWAHGVSPSYPVLLDARGSYSEGMLRGLDYLLAEAGARGLKVILSFTSNWTPMGGVDQFANMTGGSHNDFFSKEAPKALFKDFVRTIVTRTNTITGRRYSEDPTIMAWDLINEPVCRGCAPGTIASWVKEMAGFVKSLDSNHLLTVGEEGFYSTTQASIPFNPGYPDTQWATEWSQDFVADHSDPNIDFNAIHIWPDLWKCQTCSAALPVDFVQRYIEQHAKDSKALGKPLIVEEFGAQTNRDAIFKAVYDAVESSLRSGGALKGAMFWQAYVPGQTASRGEGGGAGKFGVYPGSSTFDLVKATAAAVQQLSSGPASSCSKEGPPAAGPCADKGFEGPGCDIDKNECVRSTAGCGRGAVCLNKQGGFSCECPLGSTGDGKAGCANDTAAAGAALGAFFNDPKGQACDKGQDVPFPQNAVGWADDLTGVFDRNEAFKGGFGSRVPVTLEQCALACQGAPGCDMFTYNAVQQGCFLKTGQCPLRNNCQDPELICSSVNDLGQTISVSCGTWSTWWRQEVWSAKDQYCQGLPAGSSTGGGSATQPVEAFGGGAGGRSLLYLT
ncbi:nitrilase 2 isoform A [Chlorella sorokiniana]|uniref:mannan endo-1,4-beta-mannosidase n=1 Tax=Chlorella sorokiniana TaxID=3076 RepID=A0A2P6U012_CHLSO|nr:nitrilase 2 isoform A [Chlorella sorokiniana]|eukprot:PRW59651.1 nitrilase 2 isoform A [Chlorella sorokiniana]